MTGPLLFPIAMPDVNSNSREAEDTVENRFQTPATLRHVMRILSHLAPPLAVKVATYMFCHPSRGRIKPDEEETLAAGEAFDIEIAGLKLSAWSWGEGPTVLLQHGWSSRGSRLTAFVQPLVESGFSVVTCDAPAHGSSEGRTTTGPYISRSLRELASMLGGIHSMIAHSMGCWAAALGLKEGLEVERLVFISPPSDLSIFSDIFAAQMGFTAKIQKRVEDLLAEQTGVNWSELDAGALGAGQSTPLLIIHDTDDRVVPLHHAVTLHEAWEDSELVVTSGLGHRMTVKTPSVVAQAVEFITG